MAKTNLLLSIAVSVTLLFSPCLSDPWDLVSEILGRIREPQIPNRIFNIDSYGAKRSVNASSDEEPTATVDANIKAFEDAIQAAHDAGGGTVQVPAGTYMTSAITLKSNVALEVTAGAVIKFTRDTTKYKNVFTRWEGVELWNFSPFIYAFEAENIAIKGSGTIDGNCDCKNWWPWKGYWPDEHRMCWDPNGTNQETDRNNLFQMAEDGIPVEQRVFGQGHYLRPMFIQPYRSKNILIEGVTILRSPMWIVHPVLCENVIIRNINISSLGPNSDGVDPESCKDVWITGVTFNNGDDNIAINSGRNADGRRVNRPSENIVIQNCSMADGHGGITLGSGCSGGIRNIFAENCTMDSNSLDTAIRVKNNAIRGGRLENFNVRNIDVGRVAKQVIEVDFDYEEGSAGVFMPILRECVIENVSVTDGAPLTMKIRGYAEPDRSIIRMKLKNITFNGITQEPHFIAENVNEIITESVFVNGQEWNISSGVSTTPPTLLALLVVTIFRFTILLLFTITSIETATNFQLAARDQFKFMAALYVHPSNAFCSGVLISYKTLITAAHCIKQKTDVIDPYTSIVFGSLVLDKYPPHEPNQIIQNATKVLWHPDFSAKLFTAINDIGLVIFPEIPSTKPSIAPIFMPSAPSSYTGADAMLIGWGRSKALKYVKTSVISQLSCWFRSLPFFVQTTHICTDGKVNGTNVRAFPGDSGGPLITTVDGVPTLIGIISTGSIFAGAPTVSVRIDKFLPWINENKK
ncbi:putative polygalacturonase [Pseudolycoriella hygida]|uniref:Polygalacturonase n=1 Tax=Pseudolycoriella hygida TaxID=35572 RepID=A0A9Q0S1M8_9DIPT|nr:putative polygalacturonase [Pseudolycoriella hygida]